ncbi:hypothetical protein BGZ61DRAFT_457149 [Ilyonectria robusta]|uniref:uncharacterized protein n=1 Tax=Ilyonectria robusta TaxID=1079257 RepID=UPI001E8DA5DB|nr:uncharacterized protein BGZ61DRAFT_457149 [Ilyonectria robusta]KAH8679417.1 hypothetical protein BGZ61DRAFT_457149 [Ilyonectria robusta]
MTSQPTGHQVEAVSTVAHAFAQLLISPSSSRVESLCHSVTPAELRRLKRYLAQIWLEKDTFLPLLSLSTGLARCHDRIAQALEQMLEERYTGSLTDDIQHETSTDSLPTSKLWKFAYVLGKPPMGFRAEVAIREDAAKVLPELLSLLRTWNNLVEDLVPDDPDAAEMDGNAKSRKHPKPQIDMTAFQGSVSIRTGAENLHQTLHRCWPCQSDDHDHDGALGECMEAELQLEPQWITHGNQENSFFLILKGSEISQECKVHLSHTSDRDFELDDEEAACLLIYDDWQDYCLYLGSDNTGQLWAYPSEALDVQLKIQTDLQSEAEFKLLSLEDLFHSLEPTYAAKRVMDMILARSLLLLLDGPWVTPCLSLQNVSVFCRIENGTPQPQFDKIFISTRFGHDIDPQSLRKQRLPHPFPAIQALGVLMAEIELGDDLHGIYKDMGPKSGITRQGLVAKRLLKECEKRLPLGAGVLRSIRFCIERTSFQKNIRRSPVGLIQDDTKFIESYYNNIIRPLEEDLVLGAYWSWDEINWRASRKLDDSGISKIITMAAAPPPRPPPSTSNYGGRNILPASLETLEEEKVEQQPRFQHPRQGHNIPGLVFDGGTCDLAVGEM